MSSRFDSLKHIKREVSNGGVIYILDRGAAIGPEAEAMLQALHSRSLDGLEHHLQVLSDKGSDKFMSNFYVGYGHKSIGDCGDTTIFIEGVSMLAAKAIQDSKLYNGQEASTRYIDFSKQPFTNPLGTFEGRDLLEKQRKFYLSLVDPTKKYLKNAHPKPEGEDEKVYEKAIAARAFDITRGFIPSGAQTNLAWHSSLRHISDRLLFLRHHPLSEVRNIAEATEDAVIEAYPSSFTRKRYPDTEEYQNLIASRYLHHNPLSPEIEVNIEMSDENRQRLREDPLFTQRPKKTEFPKYLADRGKVSAKFTLDFGSFRDLQRHRAIDQRMPLVTIDLGFNPWYLENLPKKEREKAKNFLANLEGELDSLKTSAESKQYYIPMGYNTSNSISGDIPSMAYMVELRATKFVHPTLRTRAIKIGEYMQNELGIPIHLDLEPDRFNINRGKHDIVLKS